MIIEALITVIYNVLSVLLVFNLPDMPDSIETVMTQVGGYFETGIAVLGAFLGDTAMSVLALLFNLVLAFNAAYALYSLVFWVIRKIPMLSVKE